jgi:YgiT-type zinc finger domain-containing protein
MKDHSLGRCALCGGQKKTARTIFAVGLGRGVLVVRNVPALVCAQCGEEWIADDIAAKLEALAEDARQRGTEVEVITLPDAA